MRYSPDPINETDELARDAFREYCDHFEPVAVIRRLDINPRTLQRIYDGERYLPPGLAREAADHLQEWCAETDDLRERQRQLANVRCLRAWADYPDRGEAPTNG